MEGRHLIQESFLEEVVPGSSLIKDEQELAR